MNQKLQDAIARLGNASSVLHDIRQAKAVAEEAVRKLEAAEKLMVVVREACDAVRTTDQQPGESRPPETCC